MTEKKSKIVCCLPVDRWAKIIAWLQIIPNVIFLIALFVQFGVLLYIGKSYVEEMLGENPSIKVLVGNSGYSGLLIWFALEFTFRLCGIGTGFLLLKAAKKRYPRYLGSWQIFSIITMAVDTPITLLLVQIGPILYTIFLILIFTAYSAFTILIIEVFKLELQHRIKSQKIDQSSNL